MIVADNFFSTVELHNSQVVLKGVETDGHVIVSAAKAEITSYEYQPVWQNQQVHSKTSWVSSIECMQVWITNTTPPGHCNFVDIVFLLLLIVTVE